MSINYDSKWGATRLKCWSRREIWSNYQSWLCTEIQRGGKTCWQLEAELQILWDCFASLCLLIRHFLLKNGAIAVHQRILLQSVLRSMYYFWYHAEVSFFVNTPNHNFFFSFTKCMPRSSIYYQGKAFKLFSISNERGNILYSKLTAIDCSLPNFEYSCRHSMRWHYIKKKKKESWEFKADVQFRDAIQMYVRTLGKYQYFGGKR